MDIEFPTDEKKILKEEKIEDFKTSEKEISLRPQTEKIVSKEKLIRIDFPIQNSYFETYVSTMMNLYKLTDTETRYVDFSGLYPRLNFLQGSSADEIRFWYDFGAINTIFLTSPDFGEINLLPEWIKSGVKDIYLNNPTMSPKDTLLLKIFSTGPDFNGENRYPAYHFMQLGKSENFSITNSTTRKGFTKLSEYDIHYRRAIGLRIILQSMEASFKRGFRTYSGPSRFSPVMITFAKKTPDSAEKFLNKKIQMIEKGELKSSPTAQSKFCMFRKHKKGTCSACTSQNDKEQVILISSSTSYEDME